MKKLIVIFVILGAFLSVTAQNDSVHTVKYTPDFKFHNGIYLTFEQFKNNLPVPLSYIVTNKSTNDIDFFNSILEEKAIVIFDNNGMKKNYSVKKIWGYCNQGVVYIQLNNEFNRIPVIGNISHFVANYSSEKYRRNDPYNSRYNPYYYDPLMRNQTYTVKELKQYILDFETGKIMDYTYNNLMVILMRDPILFEEFNQLKKRKKKKMIFFYLRRYNEKYPIFFPTNNNHK